MLLNDDFDISDLSLIFFWNVLVARNPRGNSSWTDRVWHDYDISSFPDKELNPHTNLTKHLLEDNSNLKAMDHHAKKLFRSLRTLSLLKAWQEQPCYFSQIWHTIYRTSYYVFNSKHLGNSNEFLTFLIDSFFEIVHKVNPKFTTGLNKFVPNWNTTTSRAGQSIMWSLDFAYKLDHFHVKVRFL